MREPAAARKYCAGKLMRRLCAERQVDQTHKLQPHRTMHLPGSDDSGAAAALWGASDTGFPVSGVFRDMANFAVLACFRKTIRSETTGLVLDFDVTWQGIQSWESLKNPWSHERHHGHLQHDWPYMRVGYLHAQPEQSAAGRQGHPLVSEPVVHQPSDLRVAHDHQPGHVVAGQRRI